MLSASTCYGSRSRISTWLPAPSWARSPWTAATASPTWTSPSASPTTCRVFLFPDALQVDLSMTPAAQFRPAGPRFRLLFGATAAGDKSEVSTPPVAGDLFGWGVIYGLHARACIERGRVWQAEHYVGAVRDHALSLACLRQGLPAVQARGYDDLRQRPWLDSRLPTLARSSLGRSGQPSPPPLLRSCARARRRVYRTRIPSRSASLSFADEPQLSPTSPPSAACCPTARSAAVRAEHVTRSG
jgi:hypothetical protein